MLNVSENFLYFLCFFHILNDLAHVETKQEDESHKNYANYRDGFAVYNRTCDDRWKHMNAHVARKPFSVHNVSIIVLLINNFMKPNKNCLGKDCRPLVSSGYLSLEPRREDEMCYRVSRNSGDYFKSTFYRNVFLPKHQKTFDHSYLTFEFF